MLKIVNMETEYIYENMTEKWTKINEEVSTWYLMGYPNTSVVIISLYLLIVLFLGPCLMKSRSPFNLSKVLLVYNTFQVLFSVYLTYKAIVVGCPLRDFFTTVCYHRLTFDVDRQLLQMSTSWWFMVAKLTEFLETVFFVLRKKDLQVSFLHVYHHLSSYTLSWFVLKYTPDEYTMIVMILNSFVHVIMYLYYTLSALGPQYRKYLWWKKYITLIQITQFIIFIGYLFLAKNSNCKYYTNTINILIVHISFLTVLFYNFYRNNYKLRTDYQKKHIKLTQETQ